MAEKMLSEEEVTLRETAARVLPGGTFGNEGSGVVIRRGEGGRVWDVSGNEYVDYLLGSGPMLIGHCHPQVLAAVEEQTPKGSTFFANNEHGILLAEDVADAMACADKVRFVSSGSEATFYAMRAARAFRKKDKILKFEGGFHGMNDYALMSMAPRRPGNFPQAAPDSAGIPQRVQQEVLIAPFNDAEAASELIREHKDELAGVIVEAFQRLIPPAPGFLETLREVTKETGVVLIFDEVVTGFRFAYGGAQEYYGVVPDLCSLGKVVGGGYPLACIAGSEEIMSHFDAAKVAEDEYMQQIGTLSGNPVAAAAGRATLRVLREPGAYDRLHATGRKLMDGITELLQKTGTKAQVVGEPPLFDVFFTEDDVRDYRTLTRVDNVAQAKFNKEICARGVLKGGNKYYISLAHTADDIAHTLNAVEDALSEVHATA
ncbi:MAG: Glutamate-1-semialdehyde 2,1-aminomutase [Alphaproteobacteria bacterium MarineAlpha4_Bin2]|nr:MAG: Glutamate-1-semialdehyde 2,1-aminomutase [Alphaproteobacteria bacterium MarineAlpha4_Bin2]